MPTLVDALADLPSPGLRLRTATVASFTGGTVTLTLAETTLTDVPRLASYTPTNGDIVHVLQAPGQLLVLGRAA